VEVHILASLSGDSRFCQHYCMGCWAIQQNRSINKKTIFHHI